MTATLSPLPKMRFFTAAGAPLAGGLLYTYEAGTTTPKTSYVTAGAVTANANPVVLDANGECDLWIDGNYKMLLKNSAGTQQWSVDNISGSGGILSSNNTWSGNQTFNGTANFTGTTTLGGTTVAGGAISLGSSATSTTPATTDNDTSVATTAWGQAMFLANNTGGFINGFRNAIFDIWQRGTTGSLTAATPAYTADGWYGSCTGATATWAQSGGRSTTRFALSLTGGVGVTNLSVLQRIESYIAARFLSQTVTVQIWAIQNSGGAVTPTITVKHANATDNWGAATTDVNAVSLQPMTNNTWTRLAYTFSSSASSANGLEVTFDFGNNFGDGAKSLIVGEADIRVTPLVSTGLNSNPPPPELRAIGSEFTQCLRYFWKTFTQSLTPAQSVGTNSGELVFPALQAGALGQCSPSFAFPVPMRATPTMVFYNPSAANAQVRDETNSVDCTSTSLTQSSDRGFILTCTGNAATTVAARLSIHATASAEL